MDILTDLQSDTSFAFNFHSSSCKDSENHPITECFDTTFSSINGADIAEVSELDSTQVLFDISSEDAYFEDDYLQDFSSPESFQSTMFSKTNSEYTILANLFCITHEDEDKFYNLDNLLQDSFSDLQPVFPPKLNCELLSVSIPFDASYCLTEKSQVLSIKSTRRKHNSEPDRSSNKLTVTCCKETQTDAIETDVLMVETLSIDSDFGLKIAFDCSLIDNSICIEDTDVGLANYISSKMAHEELRNNEMCIENVSFAEENGNVSDLFSLECCPISTSPHCIMPLSCSCERIKSNDNHNSCLPHLDLHNKCSHHGCYQSSSHSAGPFETIGIQDTSSPSPCHSKKPGLISENNNEGQTYSCLSNSGRTNVGVMTDFIGHRCNPVICCDSYCLSACSKILQINRKKRYKFEMFTVKYMIDSYSKFHKLKMKHRNITVANSDSHNVINITCLKTFKSKYLSLAYP
ncbi:hypothetical protein BgiBS90_014584, partial [Biomphalaria glabrata]